MNNEEFLQEFIEIYNFDFPISYLNFLKFPHNSKFYCPIVCCEFQIYFAQEAIEANAQTQISEFLPNFLIIGNDGGNELLTFKLDEPNKWAVFATPLIVMSEEDSILLANSFREFLQLFSTTK